jgi:hypothetical protein
MLIQVAVSATKIRYGGKISFALLFFLVFGRSICYTALLFSVS